jgi:CRP-like cAMP-binding protein/uncharacterized membrane protein YdbT with pleckstrin-like domain
MTIQSLMSGSTQNIVEILRQIPFLQGLPDEELESLVEHKHAQSIQKSTATVLFQQDEQPPSAIYYLVQGSVALTRTAQDDQGRTVRVVNKQVGPGGWFGHLALLYNVPYTSQATVSEPSTLIQLDMAGIKRLLFRYPEMRGQLFPQDVLNRLRTFPIFAGVDLILLSYLAQAVEIVKLGARETAYHDEITPDRLYLIHQGQMQLYEARSAHDRMWLGTGCPFGFPSVVGSNAPQPGEGRKHWAESTTPTTLYTLSWKDVNDAALVYPQLTSPASQIEAQKILKSIDFFADLDENVCERLAGFCSYHYIPQHHLVMLQGDISDSMWILREGSQATLSALNSRGETVPSTSVTGPNYFSEECLLMQAPVGTNVEAEPHSFWLQLHWSDYQRFLDTLDNSAKRLVRDEIQRKIVMRTPALKSPKSDYSRESWLGSREHVVEKRRRHWLALLRKLTLAILLLFVMTGITLALRGVIPQFGGILLIISALIVFPVAIWGAVDYANDFFIVTNERVIQQEKVVFISEYRRVAPLEQIENIDVLRTFWGSLFGYGVLSVATAGSSTPITFDFVAAPEALKDRINEQSRLRRARRRAESRQEIQDSLEKRLGLTIHLPNRVTAEEDGKNGGGKGLPWWRQIRQMLAGKKPAKRLEEQERIVWRKHPIILIVQIFVPVLILLAILAGIVIALNAEFVTDINRIRNSIDVVLGLFALPIIAWIVWVSVDWHNDTYELTRNRIVDVEKKPLFFAEQRREAQLEQIQDIEVDIRGPIQVFLDFGHVRVRTAAKEGLLTFDYVPSPHHVAEEIRRRLEERKRQEERRKTKQQMEHLPDWFEMYNRLEGGHQP